MVQIVRLFVRLPTRVTKKHIYIHSRKLTWQWKTNHVADASPIKKWWFSSLSGVFHQTSALAQNSVPQIKHTFGFCLVPSLELNISHPNGKLGTSSPQKCLGSGICDDIWSFPWRVYLIILQNINCFGWSVFVSCFFLNWYKFPIDQPTHNPSPTEPLFKPAKKPFASWDSMENNSSMGANVRNS